MKKYPNRWQFGDQVILRGVWRGNIWFAVSVYMVKDNEDLIALYWPAGTPNRKFDGRPRPEDFLTEEQPKLIAGTWTRTKVLMLVKPGEAHSVELMWDAASGDFLCWYINLQEPLRRTPLGFDTMDQALDVVISPDKARWRWKDEDELARMIDLSIFSDQQAQNIRAEGEKVIQRAQTNQPPFCDGWEGWRPPDEWQIPEFPETQAWQKIDG